MIHLKDIYWGHFEAKQEQMFIHGQLIISRTQRKSSEAAPVSQAEGNNTRDTTEKLHAKNHFIKHKEEEILIYMYCSNHDHFR